MSKDKMPSLRAGVNDLTSKKHDYVTRDQVGQMVVEIVQQALNIGLRKFAALADDRMELAKAEILDELVKRGVLPPLDQLEEIVVDKADLH